LGFTPWFRIEGFELAGATRHPQQDAGLPRLAKLVGVKRQEIEPAQPGHSGRSGPHPAKKTPPAQGASATDLDIYQRLSLPLHGSKSKLIHE
jgi:hypothetical protein